LKKFSRIFTSVDKQFSTYKNDSEIMRINRGEISVENYSKEVKEIFALAEKTKRETSGYFDIKKPDGTLDPSGVVKAGQSKMPRSFFLKKVIRISTLMPAETSSLPG